MRKYLLIIALLFFANVALGQTYTDVQPIITAKCVTCHRTGGDAPFTLETYQSLKKRTSFIKQVIEEEGISQSALSKASNVSTTTINKICNKNLNGGKISKLNNVFPLALFICSVIFIF